MNTASAKLGAGRRQFLKSLLLGLAVSTVTLSVLAASGVFSAITLVRAVRVDRTHYDVYARPSGQFQSVQFEVRGAWGTPGRRLRDGTWTARVFGHPGNGWGARTIVNGKPDAVAYSTLP